MTSIQSKLCFNVIYLAFKSLKCQLDMNRWVKLGAGKSLKIPVEDLAYTLNVGIQGGNLEDEQGYIFADNS